MWENTKDMIENFKVGYTFLFTGYSRHMRKSNRAKSYFYFFTTSKLSKILANSS